MIEHFIQEISDLSFSNETLHLWWHHFCPFAPTIWPDILGTINPPPATSTISRRAFYNENESMPHSVNLQARWFKISPKFVYHALIWRREEEICWSDRRLNLNDGYFCLSDVSDENVNVGDGSHQILWRQTKLKVCVYFNQSWKLTIIIKGMIIWAICSINLDHMVLIRRQSWFGSGRVRATNNIERVSISEELLKSLRFFIIDLGTWVISTDQ